jgi:5-methyltetrahydropteroyltriglutamate--homocysteine methyltransferase
MTVESPETVVARIKRALPNVRVEEVILAPHCGMNYLPRDVAFGKMKSMVEAAKMLRAELGG